MTDTVRPPTTLNRRELREMGLTSGGLRELYEQARDEALEKGCTCGIERIAPVPVDRRAKTYNVVVSHGIGCPLHPFNVRAAQRRAEAQARKLIPRLKRKLARK